MIKSITVTNYLGNSITLDLRNPEETGFAITSITGLGPAKAGINTVEVSTNDGALYNSARLESRNIVLSLVFLPLPTIEDVRQKSYKYFPIKKELRFEIETDNRSAYATGYVESNEPSIFSKMEGATISIICPDPYFYSLENGGIYTHSFGDVNSKFHFPFSNKSLTNKTIVLGLIDELPVEIINYEGDSDIGFTIVIDAYGPATNISIFKMYTEEVIRIDTDKLQQIVGSGIQDGDAIYIDTTKGNKSIMLLRSGEYTNILSCLSKDVSWLQLSYGDNVLSYSADTGASNLRVRIVNQVIYEGI